MVSPIKLYLFERRVRDPVEGIEYHVVLGIPGLGIDQQDKERFAEIYGVLKDYYKREHGLEVEVVEGAPQEYNGHPLYRESRPVSCPDLRARLGLEIR